MGATVRTAAGVVRVSMLVRPHLQVWQTRVAHRVFLRQGAREQTARVHEGDPPGRFTKKTRPLPAALYLSNRAALEPHSSR